MLWRVHCPFSSRHRKDLSVTCPTLTLGLKMRIQLSEHFCFIFVYEALHFIFLWINNRERWLLPAAKPTMTRMFWSLINLLTTDTVMTTHFLSHLELLKVSTFLQNFFNRNTEKQRTLLEKEIFKFSNFQRILQISHIFFNPWLKIRNLSSQETRVIAWDNKWPYSILL